MTLLFSVPFVHLFEACLGTFGAELSVLPSPHQLPQPPSCTSLRTNSQTPLCSPLLSLPLHCLCIFFPCCCAGQWTQKFEVLIPQPDPQTPSARDAQGSRGLSPQTVRSSDVACASLQLLFLLLRQLKRIRTALAQLQPQKQKSHRQEFRHKCNGLVCKKMTALKDSFQQLVSFLGMVPHFSTPSHLSPPPSTAPNQSPPAD